MDNAKTCRFGFIHVIEQGDTLYKLGKRYGVTFYLRIHILICTICRSEMNCAFRISDAEDAKRQKGKIWIRKERMKCRAFHNLKCL